jgi:hypothetical protein
MSAFAASFVAVLFAVAQIVLISVAPSIRLALRDAAPRLEDRYFAPWFLRSAFGGLRLTEVFAVPPPELAASKAFTGSLRLFRTIVVVWALLLLALIALVATW